MAMMNDPSVMMNMMQGNFAMMVPQMVMMGALVRARVRGRARVMG